MEKVYTIKVQDKETVSLDRFIETLMILKKVLKERGQDTKNMPIFMRKNVTEDFDDFIGIDQISAGEIDEIKDKRYRVVITGDKFC